MDPDELTTEATEAPAPAPAEAPAPPPAPAEAPAPAPAPAEGGEPPAEPKSLEEALLLGMERSGLSINKDGETAPGETSPETPAEAQPPVAKTVEQPGAAEPENPDADIPEPTEAQMKGANPELRKHVKRVHTQNQRLKTQVRSMSQPAEQFNKLQAFLTTNELDASSAANALRIAAYVQGAINGRADPGTAITEVQAILAQLQGLSGDVLPDDVQQSLDDGTIDEAHAREIARLRAQGTTLARRAQIDTEASNTQAVATHSASLRSAIQTWEQAIRARDPDYQQKASLVDALAYRLRSQQYGVNGMPPTPQHAVAIAQRAYDEVTRTMTPRSAAVRAPLNGAASPKSTVRTAPKTMQEAILQGLERAGT